MLLSCDRAENVATGADKSPARADCPAAVQSEMRPASVFAALFLQQLQPWHATLLALLPQLAPAHSGDWTMQLAVSRDPQQPTAGSTSSGWPYVLITTY